MEMSPETRRKISIAKKGSTPWNKGKTGVYSSESLDRFRRAKIGTKWSDSLRLKMAEIKKNKKATRWIEDRTKIKRGKRSFHDADYKMWHKTIKIRDKGKCKINNNECKGVLEIHHILSWRDFPKLRYEINNGITLCKFHHPRKRSEENRLSPYFQSLIQNYEL